MLTAFNNETIRDFPQRYSNTFGWLINKENNTKKFVHINEVEDQRLHFNTDSSDEGYWIRTNNNIFFEFIPVNKGWFNGEDGKPYYLCRKTARQWKRGISPNNTFIYSVYSNIQHVNFDNLKNIFNDNFEYLNYPKEFKHGALSRHFCLLKSGEIYFYETCVGYFNNNKITVMNSLITQEITDLCNRNNWSVEVST